MNKIDYKELASKIFCIGALGIIIILSFKYALKYVLPFLIAWGVAYLVYPISQELSSKIKISRKVCSFVLVLSFIITILSLIFLLGNRLLYEIQNFMDTLNNNSDAISEYAQGFFDFINSIGERIPLLNKLNNTELSNLLKENVNKLVVNMWESLISALSSAIPNLAKNIVMALPDALLSGLITIISCFYFAMDIDSFHRKLKSILPPKAVETIRKFKRKIGSGFKKYIKAYVIIFLLTFAELLIGFWILRIDYSVVLALIISLIDFLPVLGTGAILIPWGIVLLFMNDIFKGVGILVLFVVTTVVRQIAEPKILGDTLGVHPLITLAAIYLGYRVFGIVGMIIAPLAALLLLAKEKAADQ